MIAKRALQFVCLAGAIAGSIPTASADAYPVIIQGKVVMDDGTPPPVTVSMEKYCSDVVGSAPGPLTNKKGEYVWRMDVDPFKTRSCVLRASHAGYTSTSVDISALNGVSTTITLPDIVVSSQASDPYAIIVGQNAVPGKVKKQWDAAMKAIDNGNHEEAANQLNMVTEGAPKFALGWHALGVLNDRMQKNKEARDAYEHAIAADPKLLPAYIILTRLCVKTGDWKCVSETATNLIKVDGKNVYSEAYLHRAVARFETKDLDGALSDAQDALRLDARHKRPRTEYVLGRILEAKGDANGAREHIMKYLDLEPTATDASRIRTYLENMGKAGGAGDAPPLESL